jgi:hypothetical protein
MDDSRTPPRFLVVTAGHVQEGGYTPYIIWQGQKLPATVLMPNSGYDLMALECSGPPIGAIVLPLATEYAQVGEAVRCEGFVAQVRQDGIVTGYGGVLVAGPILEYRQALMDVRGQSHNGMSGGPIYDRRGLQGVMSASLPDNGKLRGTSTLQLWDLLPKAGIHVEGTRYRLSGGVEPVEPAAEPADPSPVVNLPLPPVDEPGPDPCTPCAGIAELTARVEALENRPAAEPDVAKIAAVLLAALKADIEFQQTVADLVNVEPAPIDPAALAKKIQPHLDPITFRHIDGKTKEVFAPEEPIRLGEGYEFIRHKIDWEKAAEKIAPHLPQPEGGTQ